MAAGHVSGHVYLARRKRGDQWYAKYRLASGKQIQKRLGPAWSERGRSPEGYLTKKTAEARLQEILADARRGLLPDRSDTSGKTFGDALAEHLRYVEHELERTPATVTGYRSVAKAHLLPEFGTETPLEQITTERIDELRMRLLDEGELARRTIQKVLTQLHGILKLATRRGWLAANPAEGVERVKVKRSGDFNVLTPAEVLAVARVASEALYGALITVAAFTGLRMGELRALRWCDVDFAAHTVFVRWSYTQGHRGRPKSTKVRSVPLDDHAARALDASSRRELFTGAEDLVFCNPLGGYLDDGEIRDAFYAALRAAGLGHRREGPDPFVFHDLRHTFGTIGAAVWPLHDLQAYMGHADIQTTMIYIHHIPKTTDAAALSRAIAAQVSAEPDEREPAERS